MATKAFTKARVAKVLEDKLLDAASQEYLWSKTPTPTGRQNARIYAARAATIHQIGDKLGIDCGSWYSGATKTIECRCSIRPPTKKKTVRRTRKRW